MSGIMGSVHSLHVSIASFSYLLEDFFGRVFHDVYHLSGDSFGIAASRGAGLPVPSSELFCSSLIGATAPLPRGAYCAAQFLSGIGIVSSPVMKFNVSHLWHSGSDH